MHERGGRGTIQDVYWVLLLAAGAILGGVVVVAMGRGGEMAVFSRDLPTSATDPRTPMEVATQRLPLGPLGYQPQATEEALMTAAYLLAERDKEIAALRTEIWRLGGDPAVRHDQPATEFGDRPGVRAPAVQVPALPASELASASEPASEDGPAEAAGAAGVGPEQSWRK